MLKSFSVDLSHFGQYGVVGEDKTSLRTDMRINELYSCLVDLGYHNVNPPMQYHPLEHHDLDGLRNCVETQALGIHVNAFVHLRYMGVDQQRALVTFHY